MIDAEIMAAVLNSLKDPLLFTNTEHKILYMNKAAIEHYSEDQNLMGNSLLDCHNEESQRIIKDTLAKMHSGIDEQLITDNEKHRIYMRAVRAVDGSVIGYYERYEPPEKY